MIRFLRIDLAIASISLVASYLAILGPEASLAEDEFVTIELMPRANVSAARVFLSDISKCTGSARLCKEATGIDIASTPAPGRTSIIKRGVVSSVLAKEWPSIIHDITGADSTRVDAASIDVSADEVRLRLQKELDLLGHKQTDMLRVRVTKIQGSTIMVRPNQTQVEFDELQAITFDDPDWVVKNLSGNRPIRVSFLNPADPSDYTVAQLYASVSVERKLPVPKVHIASGHIIAESQVKVSWVTMRRGVLGFVDTMDELVGKKAKQAIEPGEPVFSRYLDAPLAVGRNQVVKMIVKKGDLEIAAKATTIDQGAIGQTIQVVNMANKMRMRAKVVDDKTVEAVSF
jgi:flagella basal body P-ring formation protein FlgA